MAFLNVNTPLKNLKTGDYFYPLTNLDQIITGSNRLSAFMSEDNSNHNLLNLNNIKSIIGNITINGTLTIISKSSSWLEGQNDVNKPAFNLNDATNNGSYWPWIRQTNTTSAKWFSFGILNNSFYWIGSVTSRTSNGYDHGMRFDISSGLLECEQGYFTTNLGIGGTNTSYKLYVNGTSFFGNEVYFNSNIHWKVNTNWVCDQVTANNQEWSFDMNSGSYTGCYWHVWSSKNSASCLQCFNDDRHSWAFKLYGAVWNDYAEFRETKKEIEPGRCIVETGQGDLILSTKRMQEGCEIVSDTFGFAIGQSKKCNTPTAASGRVLAFPYENKELFKPGKPVCSGPNGTVSIMTEEEAKEYPWCIIGTVSEIPNYTEWQCGDEHTKPLKVNGRIWIRIR